MAKLINFYFAVLLSLLTTINGIELKNGAYEDFVVKISEDVPVKDCRIVLDNLETTLTSASQYLFAALDSRAYLRSIIVLIPPTWPETCTISTIIPGEGELADLTIVTHGPAQQRFYTQQSLGCGQQGDQIYLGYEALMKRDPSLGRSLVKEFAKYRYGVFEEQGYYNDPIYPLCFYDDEMKHAKVTGCSELPIHDNGICENRDLPYNTSQMIDEKARSSIMFAAESPSVSMFCDDGNHDRFAPTKHNSICQRRSVLDVIMNHSDFLLNNNSSEIFNSNNNQITDTTPTILYKKQNLTRYVVVLENTQDMLQRESWNYLKRAMMYWSLHILPKNTEIGMVLAGETAKKVLNIVPIYNGNNDDSNKDKFYSSIPYIPSDSAQPGCLHCALKDAVDMLTERNRIKPANNIILVIAAGMNRNQQIEKILQEIKRTKIKIATINYPTIVRKEPLNYLSEQTNGISYTVFEQKLNIDNSLLTTYFELNNILTDIVHRFYSGSPSDLPIEIHRRRIIDDGRNSITGSFVLDTNLGKPAKFVLFTHNSITPLIKSIKLISPSHHIYTERNDRFIDFKMISVTANINETGTWTYTVEPYPGNPQPHFLQVIATPISVNSPVVQAKFWIRRSTSSGPLTLLVECKYGELPILDAKVEVIVAKQEINGSLPHKHRFDLFDTGSGDPDIMKGDGIYTRYFSAIETGPGLYTFEVIVNDNGNVAYTWTDSVKFDDSKPCCGSSMSSTGVTPISPFQRILPKITLQITPDDISTATTNNHQQSIGRIGDLKVQLIIDDMKARLIWTSPDMGGYTVSHYEIRYAFTINDIMDHFETNAIIWDGNNGQQPHPLAPGSETTFTIDLNEKRDLLDKSLYFAIKAYPKFTSEYGGPVSNWVRVFIPSPPPPPPPTIPPTYSTNEQTFWPNNLNTVGVDRVNPTLVKSMSLELILPISIGFILLLILLILYCYFCVLKRRNHHGTDKKQQTDKMNSTITIVPNTPQTPINYPTTTTTTTTDLPPDPHTIGVPINYDYDEDTKKRYSLVNQQEQQLIDELKQQQQLVHQGLSVISNGTLNRNGHPLSPYNSWSASQLLHEHERRHSPAMDDINQQFDHVSLNGQQQLIPPPVPPLPAFNSNGYPVNYSIYGVHSGIPPQQQQQQQVIYQSMQRNETMVPPSFNPSLQGSMSSVNSGDKKRRNVTMV